MQTIPDLIAQTARRYGRRPALGIRRGLRTEVWSYQDVERGMHAVARRLESLIKRELGVKDAGAWLPGFGGLLDRADSLVVTIPLIYHLARLVMGHNP